MNPLTRLSTYALAALAIFGWASSPSLAANKKIVVGFSQIGAESGWRTANTESIKSEAAKRGIELKFADAQQKQENQIKALRSFIAQGVDVIGCIGQGIILKLLVESSAFQDRRSKPKIVLPIIRIGYRDGGPS